MPLYDLFADGQPNPRTHVLADPVQALEHFENAAGKPRVESYAVVSDREQPIRGLRFDPDVHDGLLVTAEL